MQRNYVAKFSMNTFKDSKYKIVIKSELFKLLFYYPTPPAINTSSFSSRRYIPGA